MVVARNAGKMLVVGGRLIMLGGKGGQVEVEEYDVEKKTWSVIQQKIKRGRSWVWVLLLEFGAISSLEVKFRVRYTYCFFGLCWVCFFELFQLGYLVFRLPNFIITPE